MVDVDPVSSPHILVVDDEVWWLRRAEWALEQAGYRVTAVSDGAAALERARSQAFALIVLDVMMPWMDGFEVHQALRAEGLDTPCLLLTLKAADAAAMTWTDTANRMYLRAKPSAAANLVHIVGEVLSAVGS